MAVKIVRKDKPTPWEKEETPSVEVVIKALKEHYMGGIGQPTSPAPTPPLTHKKALELLYEVMFGVPGKMDGMLFTYGPHDKALKNNFHPGCPPEKLYQDHQKKHIGYPTLKDLQEAIKAALDAPAPPLAPWLPQTASPDEQAIALARLTWEERHLLLTGKIIDAIKSVRQRVGCGVAQAKNLVDLARGYLAHGLSAIAVLSEFPVVSPIYGWEK